MIKAPPILGPMDLLGLTNSKVLIEGEEELILSFSTCLIGKTVVCFTPNLEELSDLSNIEMVAVQTDSIIKTVKTIKECQADIYLIHRIDMFLLDFDKRARGQQIKGWLSMVNHKYLKGGNLIISSAKEEYMLRELADHYFNLRLPNQ
jgi:hypothetical protein